MNVLTAFNAVWSIPGAHIVPTLLFVGAFFLVFYVGIRRFLRGVGKGLRGEE